MLIGLGLVATGSWLHASTDVYAYITVYVRSINDDSLVAAAALLLTTGVILTLLSVLGFLGVWFRHQKTLKAYLWLQPLVLILGITAGFLAVALYWDIHMRVKPAMQSQLDAYYQWESHVGKAWNRVQVKKRCCGVDGSWDYEKTSWFADNNPPEEVATIFVPDSCCVLNFNDDRNLYWVDPQNPVLKDPKRCQEDAEGKIINSANVNTKGCYAALFQINNDLWNDVTIMSVIFAIGGLGLGAGFLQVIGIVLTFFYIRSLNKENSTPEKEQMVDPVVPAPALPKKEEVVDVDADVEDDPDDPVTVTS